MPISHSSVQTAMQSAQSVPASSPLEARCTLRGKTMAEYIFIGGTGGDLRSKTRVLDSIPAGPEDCPVLTFDGTLTGQVSSQMCQDASCLLIQLLPGGCPRATHGHRGWPPACCIIMPGLCCQPRAAVGFAGPRYPVSRDVRRNTEACTVQILAARGVQPARSQPFLE